MSKSVNKKKNHRYHYDETRPKENFPIGDAAVKLEPLRLTEEAMDKTFSLTNPNTGKSEGEVHTSIARYALPNTLTNLFLFNVLRFLQATLRFVCLAPEDALRILEESVYEYQQCRVFTQWEALANPGRYRTLLYVLLYWFVLLSDSHISG